MVMRAAYLLLSACLCTPVRAEESSATALAQPVVESGALMGLEERITRLENDRVAPGAAGPVVTLGGTDGFGFRAADGSAAIRFTGLVQSDVRVFHGDRRKPFANTIVLRRVRPGIDVAAGAW